MTLASRPSQLVTTALLLVMVVAGLAALPGAMAESCPNITAFRSSYVAASFNPQLVTGFWFEQAYIDPAQAGASCQTLNTTYNAATGELVSSFRVDYGSLPFTIVELYDPVNTTRALYKKHVQMPGGQLVILPTVIVDVTLNAAGTSYDTLTMYSCVSLVGESITELIFATRNATAPDAQLQAMEDRARALGVQWNQSDLKRSSHTNCK